MQHCNTTESFTPLYDSLIRTDSFCVVATGEVFSITASEKIIYSFILNRYRHFNKSGSDYFESMQEISYRTASNLKTTQRAMSKFIDKGIVCVSKTKGRSNVYIVNWFLDVVAPVEHVKQVGKTNSKSFSKSG